MTAVLFTVPPDGKAQTSGTAAGSSGLNCGAAMLLHRHMTITLAQKSSRENEYRRSGSRVAVVVPNYNHGHFIGEALSSIAAQTRAPDVVLIIDDASTDDSIAIISSFIDCHPTWQLIRHNVRQGVVIGQNEALRQLDVDWVTFLGADDILHSSYIERAGKQIELASRLCEGAFDALMSGDSATHDAKVTVALKEMSQQVDVIVLAQASMARVVETLSGADKRVPILASPGIAASYLATILQ